MNKSKLMPTKNNYYNIKESPTGLHVHMHKEKAHKKGLQLLLTKSLI